MALYLGGEKVKLNFNEDVCLLNIIMSEINTAIEAQNVAQEEVKHEEDLY